MPSTIEKQAVDGSGAPIVDIENDVIEIGVFVGVGVGLLVGGGVSDIVGVKVLEGVIVWVKLGVKEIVGVRVDVTVGVGDGHTLELTQSLQLG